MQEETGKGKEPGESNETQIVEGGRHDEECRVAVPSLSVQNHLKTVAVPSSYVSKLLDSTNIVILTNTPLQPSSTGIHEITSKLVLSVFLHTYFPLQISWAFYKYKNKYACVLPLFGNVR